MTRRTRPRRVAIILFASAALVAPFMAFVWGHVEILQTGYQMEKLEDRLDRLEHENRRLRVEKARLSALPRIEKKARELGLEPLPMERLVVMASPQKRQPPKLVRRREKAKASR